MRRLLATVVALCIAGALLVVAPAPVPVGAAVGDTDLELSVLGTYNDSLLGLASSIDWTITLTNATADQNPVATATGVRVRDVVTASATVGLPRSAITPSTGTYDAATRTWTVPTLAPGATVTLRFRTTFSISTLASPNATLTAQVTQQGQTDLDSQPEATEPASGDQDDEGVYRIGEGTRYTVGDLVWRDLNGDGRLTAGEPGLRGVQVIVDTIGGTRLFAGPSSSTGAWSYAAVPASTAVVVTFIAPAGLPFTTPKVGSDDGDSDPQANGVTASRTISAGTGNIDAGLRATTADLSLSLGFSPTTGAIPFTTTGTLRVPNAGPGPSLGVVAGARIPSGTTVVGAPTASQGTVTITSSGIVWTLGTVLAETTPTLTYQLRATSTGSYETTAHVTAAATPDPDSTPNPLNASCSAGTSQDDCATATVTATGVATTGTVRGTVWRDTSLDGQRQVGEAVQAGVAVRLRSVPADAIVATVTTATDGTYVIPAVAVGSYAIEVLALIGAAFTAANVGSDATDSDVATTTGRAPVTVTTGAASVLDAGLVPSDAPTNDTVLVPQGVTATFNVLDNDGIPGRPAGGALPSGWSWARPTAPAWASVTCTATGACTLVPVRGYAGTDSFTYTLTNPTFGARTVNVAITVLYVNDPPITRDDRAVTSAGTAILVSPLANDEDPNSPATASDPDKPGDTLVVSASGAMSPAGAGAASCSTTTCTFTPTAGFTGVAQFTYTARDSGRSDDRVDDAGVPGGIAVVAPRTATATVRVWVDPAPRVRRGFTGRTSTTTLTGVARWVLTSTTTPVASCSAGRPRIAVTWTPAAKATSYTLERQSVVGGPWITLTATTATTHTDDAVGESNAYRYRVTPYRHRWAGMAGPIATATAPATTTPAGCA